MRQKILASLYEAIDELNATRSADAAIEKHEETTLLGDDGVLDSLSMVNFLLISEQKLTTAFRQQVSLAERVMLGETGDGQPPQTVAGFVDLLEGVLAESSS